MTEPRRIEVSDVEVVLKAEFQGRNSLAIEELRRHGLSVTDVDEADGVIEGTIPSDRLAELKGLEAVAQLRSVLSYLSEVDDDPQPEGAK